jgi:hypothetical protein
MKRFLLAFGLVAMAAQPLLAQNNVRVIGRAPDGTDRPILATTDGRLLTSGTATARPTGAGADQVQGTDANGTAPTGNPQLVAGWDGTNVRTIRTSANGSVAISGAAAVPDGTGMSAGAGIVDAATGITRPLSANSMVYNGVGNFYYQRDANSASGTTGNGLLGVGSLGWDGTAYRRFRTLADGSQVVSDMDGGPVTVTPLTAVGVLFSVPTTGYAGVSYVTNTGWSGSTINFEGSNDSTDGTNGSWTGISVQIVGSSTPTTQTQSSGAAFFIPAYTTYVRARVSAYASGTIGGAAALRSFAPLTQSATINNNKSLWYTESSNAASVAIGANLNGSTRDTGVAAADYRYANWSCFANPAVSSTGALLVAQGSLDNITWVTTQVVSAATAGQASTTQNGIFFRYNRCMFNNTAGSAATTVFLMGRYSE